jgi:hypothetical protein
MNVGRLLVLCAGSSADIAGTHFLLEFESTRGQSAAWRIKSMKNTNDHSVNRNRDLSGCNSVPQPNVPLPSFHEAIIIFYALSFDIFTFWRQKQEKLLSKILSAPLLPR